MTYVLFSQRWREQGDLLCVSIGYPGYEPVFYWGAITGNKTSFGLEVFLKSGWEVIGTL